MLGVAPGGEPLLSEVDPVLSCPGVVSPGRPSGPMLGVRPGLSEDGFTVDLSQESKAVKWGKGEEDGRPGVGVWLTPLLEGQASTQ